MAFLDGSKGEKQTPPKLQTSCPPPSGKGSRTDAIRPAVPPTLSSPGQRVPLGFDAFEAFDATTWVRRLELLKALKKCGKPRVSDASCQERGLLSIHFLFIILATWDLGLNQDQYKTLSKLFLQSEPLSHTLKHNHVKNHACNIQHVEHTSASPQLPHNYMNFIRGLGTSGHDQTLFVACVSLIDQPIALSIFQNQSGAANS